MIQQTPAWKASDGRFYQSLDGAQIAELTQILKEADITDTDDWPGTFAAVIVQQREAVLNILTMSPKARPTRRKANGYPGHKRAAAAKASSEADRQALTT